MPAGNDLVPEDKGANDNKEVPEGINKEVHKDPPSTPPKLPAEAPQQQVKPLSSLPAASVVHTSCVILHAGIRM